MDAVRLAVLNEEFHRAGVPRVNRGMGESLVGPSIIVHATPRAAGVLPAPHHLRRGRLLPGLLRAQPRLRPGGRGDPRRGQRRRDRHHRAEGLDVRRRQRQPDVPAVPDRRARGEARGALLRAHRLHRPRRHLPADQADVGRRGVLRGLHRRRARAAVQRHRRAQQRLAGRDDHARPRARRPRHRGAPRLRAGVLGAGRDRAQAGQDRPTR